MKKILILTVTAGNGHNSCSKALKEKLIYLAGEKGEQVDVKIVDLLKSYTNPVKVWIADGGYNFAIGKLPQAYEWFYNLYKEKDPNDRYKCASQGYAVSISEGLYKEINSFKPDVIFSAHFYGAMAITDLKLIGKIPCKTLVTSLDYVNSPFWEACNGVDYFNIPNEDFADECIYEGFKREQLLTFGIPVREQFLTACDKQKTREELGLDKDVFTFMVMFGGGYWNGGLKIFEDLVSVIPKDKKVQIIMINGKNKQGYDYIAKKTFPQNIKVVNVGFTDKVDLYMSASDLMLSKIGGLSSTECINKSLPALITSKVYGQERYNLEYLEGKGVVKSFKNKKELKALITGILSGQIDLEEMRKNTLPLKKDAIKSIAEFILSLPNANYDENYINSIDYKKIKSQIRKALRKEDKSLKKNLKQSAKIQKQKV